MPPDLTTLVQNLSWTPLLPECCCAWLATVNQRCEQRFRDYCQRNEKLDWLLTTFLGLGVDQRKEFLLSPPVSYQLLAMEAGRMPDFPVLAGEFVRVLARSDKPGAYPAVAEMLLPLSRDYADVQGIPVDFDSTFRFPSRDAKAGALHALSPERAHLVKQRLEEALDALRQGNLVAYEFVRLMTRRLAVRDEVRYPEGSTSSSFGELIGLVFLTNLRPERADAAWLIDALVHESIHAALFLCEVSQDAWALDKDPAPCLRSPWTGNLLPCHQYVHACFVWFGLAQLWKSWAAGAGGIAAEQSRAMDRRASQGFLACPVESLLSQDAGRRLAPPLKDALVSLERLALAA
jgi:HEXXH motif-containing protein